MSAIGRQGDVAMNDSEGFTTAELERRRASSRRLAWLLGAVAVAIYVIGFAFYRP
ncbi:MAG TPA: hypothetical protein PLS67_02695 [Accumulibacter sp.]|jgi:hypothetical protein|nr:hypothetical protein [Accumulibacter sp.]HQC79416.1 hypothetical protein [Accumulibacter sp.]